MVGELDYKLVFKSVGRVGLILNQEPMETFKAWYPPFELMAKFVSFSPLNMHFNNMFQNLEAWLLTIFFLLNLNMYCSSGVGYEGGLLINT